MDFIGSIFQPVVDILQHFLSICYDITGMVGFKSYGLAIIFMTFFIKMLLYPLTVKQVKSMKAMQKVQPKIKAAQAKYKGNPELLNQEIMRLYKEEGANPLAGCLPLLAQMPILMGMFYALRDFNYQGEPSFMWLPSLSAPDPIYILPLLSMATTFYQQKQTTDDIGDQGAQMKIMMYIMPLFIGYLSLDFASGLVLYWVTMNSVQIGQQWFMVISEKQKEKKEKELKKAEKKAEKTEKAEKVEKVEKVVDTEVTEKTEKKAEKKKSSKKKSK